MELYNQTVDGDWFRQRLIGITIIISIAFLILISRLYYLQIIKGENYFRLSENNCIRRQALPPIRGMIYDRNGALLVDNRPSYDLTIIPKNAKPLDETLERLGEILQTSVDELNGIITKKGALAFKSIVLRQDIDRDLLAAIEARKYDLPGVSIDVTTRRHYVYNECASHLIGYLGEISGEELELPKYKDNRPGDYVGKYGIEKQYEATLRGRRGERLVEVDAKGQVVNVLKTIHGETGANVHLSIDIELQKKAEELLKDRVGAVVALDPNNGEVLALVSSPSFNQNTFADGVTQAEWNLLASNPFRPLENKAIQGTYPPASTYKIVTAMAGLEEGVINLQSSVFCPGFYYFGGRDFRCWKKPGHGHMNVVRALAESCDVFFYQAGQNIGIDRLAWYAKACGLGSKTGVPLDHEARGLVPSAWWKQKNLGAPWYKGETLSVAIGQGYNLATPIQMAVLTAAIANGGKRLQPVVLKSDKTRILGSLPVHPETLNLIRRGLWEVVNSPGGTAGRVRIEGLDICGKTGTAQVIGRNDNSERVSTASRHKSHGWFVAYAPLNNPKIALAIIIEHGESGSGAAGPVAKELIGLYLKPPEAPAPDGMP